MMANSAQLLNSIAQMEKKVTPRYRFASSCVTADHVVDGTQGAKTSAANIHAATVHHDMQ